MKVQTSETVCPSIGIIITILESKLSLKPEFYSAYRYKNTFGTHLVVFSKYPPEDNLLWIASASCISSYANEVITIINRTGFYAN